jgi:hypothetical protein
MRIILTVIAWILGYVSIFGITYLSYEWLKAKMSYCAARRRQIRGIDKTKRIH